MTKGISSRQVWAVGVFVFTALSSLLVSFSRIDLIGVVYAFAVLGALAIFTQVWSQNVTLISFAGSSFKIEFGQVIIAFLAVIVVRFGLFYLSGTVWEKASMIVLTILLIVYVERHQLIDFGLTLVRIFHQLLWGLIGTVSLWVSVALSSVFVPIVLGVNVSSYFFDVKEFSLSMLVAFAFFLIGNFAEELFFRGYITTKLKKSGLVRAIIIQALLFAIYHLNYLIGYEGDLLGFGFYIVFVLLFGVLMGLVFVMTGSVITTTIIHASFNIMFPTLQLAPLARTATEDVFFSSASYGVGVVMLVLLISLLLVMKRSR
ncbi:MAG TPA: type II CAAX endopeptidase family protein [Caldisericia bacterium]|nr:type II CAAX endopeptidase family protein [Caldisericia bacterium]HPF49372.1 type II CAAX endopeptidase family protein [Caldisericia bacterium]HPI84448.1 type II CAAX endopeptidase family protein [Caldisericia bacterium]HPQ93791.1 type II CAAX endopeptidase family protein [Caldisericia bacterium]